MTDVEKIFEGLNETISYFQAHSGNTPERCAQHLRDAIAFLKEQENEYENGFNDAMLGKQELMYEGIDGKWHKKDW